MIRLFLLPIVALAIVLTMESSTFACKCATPPQPMNALKKASAVFSGKVVKIEIDNKTRMNRVSVEVEHVWKGIEKRKVVVQTFVSGKSCGFVFKKDESYLIYCFSSDPLTTNNCMRTKLLAKTGIEIKELGEGKKVEGKNDSKLKKIGLLDNDDVDVAVRVLMRKYKTKIDGTAPPKSWPSKIRKVDDVWVTDIDTSKLPGGYPEQIVVKVFSTGGHSGLKKISITQEIRGVLTYDPLLRAKRSEAWHGWHFRVDGQPVLPSKQVSADKLRQFVGKHVVVSGRHFEGTLWKPDSGEQGPVKPMRRGWGLRVTRIEKEKKGTQAKPNKAIKKASS